MPGLGDIRGHVRRGLKLKPSTSSARIKQRLGKDQSSLLCEVDSINERKIEDRKVNKRKFEKHKEERHESVNDWTYQNTELYSSFGSSVTLIVGDNEVPFMAHKRMLRNISPFFYAACKREWLHKDNSIHLPDDEPDAVQTMLYWVYHNRLGVPERLFHKEKIVGVDATMESAPGLLAKVYVLAEKYQVQELMKDAIDGLIFWYQEHRGNSKIPAKVIQYVFEIMPDIEQFALPRVINALVDQQYKVPDFAKAKDDLPFDFFFQYCSQMTLLKDQKCTESNDQSYYSTHTLLGNGTGSQAKELKQYIMIAEDQGD